MCCTNTRATMLDRLVRNRKFSKVVADHLWLDFDGVEDLPVVDPHNRTNHLGNNDHVTEMGLHNSRFLVRWRLLFRLTQFFNESHGAAFQATLEPTACTSVDDLDELLIAKVQELVELDPAI